MAWAETVHGLLLTDTGRVAEGEECLRRALETCHSTFREGDRRTALAEGALGHCLAAQKRYGEAERLLLESSEGMKRAVGERHTRTRQVQQWLVDLYDAWGRPAEAAAYRAVLARSALP